MAHLPQYKHGKVEGLDVDLTVVSERGETPMVCCGWCSAHMAAITAKPGLSNRMTNEAHEMRSKGGRPHNAGNRAGELREGALKAVEVILRSVAIEDIPDRLRSGYAVAAGIQYARLPAWLKIQTNDFGHAVCLYGWKGDGAGALLGFFDPLWDQDARGAWSTWAEVKNALWPNGNHSTTIERYSMSGAYAVFNDEVQSRKVADFAKGVDFYKDVELTTRLGEFSRDSTGTQMFGQRQDAYAIQISTGTLYADGVVRPTTVYVKQSTAKNIRTLPVPVVPPAAGCTPAEVTKHQQEGYDLALSVFPPRPK